MVALCNDDNEHVVSFFKVLFLSVKFVRAAIFDLQKTCLTPEKHGSLGNKNKD